jgi:hypothetical protein
LNSIYRTLAKVFFISLLCTTLSYSRADEFTKFQEALLKSKRQNQSKDNPLGLTPAPPVFSAVDSVDTSDEPVAETKNISSEAFAPSTTKNDELKNQPLPQEWPIAVKRCNFNSSLLPYDDRFKNIKAYGLLVSDLRMFDDAIKCQGHETACAKQYVSNYQRDLETPEAQQAIDNRINYYKMLQAMPIRSDRLIEGFGNTIKKYLLGYLIPDDRCQIPDLEIFKGSRTPPYSVYLKDFMSKPGRLLISIQTNFFTPEGHNFYALPDQKLGYALLTLNLYRSDTQFSDWGNAWDTKQHILLPLDLPEDKITSQLKNLVRSIVPVTPGEVTMCGGLGSDIKKILADKPPVRMLLHPRAAIRPTTDIKFLEIAAERGDAASQYQIAELYELGIDGIKQSYPNAERWYLRAANQGHQPAQVALARLYRQGFGIPKNVTESYFWTLVSQGNQVLHHAIGNYNLRLELGLPETENVIYERVKAWKPVVERK